MPWLGGPGQIRGQRRPFSRAATGGGAARAGRRSTDLGRQGEKAAKARTPAADRRRPEAIPREPCQQAADGNPSLEARDVETGADVSARAKRQVPVWLARNVE